MLPPVEIGRAFQRAVLANAAAGSEGARKIGAQLAGFAGANVQTVLESLRNRLESHDHSGGVVKPNYIEFPEQAVVPALTADALRKYAIDVQGITTEEVVGPTGLRLRPFRDTYFIVKNGATALAKGTIIYSTGTVAQEVPTVSPARSDSAATMPALGILAQDIGANASGRAMTSGKISGLDTSAWAIGTQLYVSSTAAGALTGTRPSANSQPVAWVLNSHASDGVLRVSVGAVEGSGGGGGGLLGLASQEVPLNAATTLDSSSLGKMHVLSGAGSFTVVLPPVANNAGKTIGFRVARGYSFWATLDGNAAETIDGEATRIMWEQESAVLLCTGSEWTKVSGRFRAMTCAMRQNSSTGAVAASQSISSGAVQKVLLDKVDLDLGGLGDAANGRINIRRPGLYRVVATVYFASGAANRHICALRQNSTTEYFSAEVATSAAGSFATPQAANIIVPTGTVELHAFQDSGAAKSLLGSAAGAASLLSVQEVSSW